MKNMLRLIAAVMVIAGLAVVSCLSSPSGTATASSTNTARKDALDALDEVIEKSYGNLSRNMKNGARIAVLPLGVADKETGDTVYDTLTVSFVNSLNYEMVERQEIDRILQEQDFQVSGMVDDNTAVSLGHFLGAEVIIIGDISGTVPNRRLVFRALEVETAKIVAMSSERF